MNFNAHNKASYLVIFNAPRQNKEFNNIYCILYRQIKGYNSSISDYNYHNV